MEMLHRNKLMIAAGFFGMFIFYQRNKSRKQLDLKPYRKKSSKFDGKTRRLLLIASGSIATVKVPYIVQQLIQKDIYVDLVLTEHSLHFLNMEYNGVKGHDLLKSMGILRSVDGTHYLEVWKDSDEWSNYSRIGDPVLHVDLVKRNSLLLIAPITANTLAAMATGFSYSLATSSIRAWHYNLQEPFSSAIAEQHGAHVVNKPVYIAPAMNTFMWYQRTTNEHLKTLNDRGVKVIQPESKTLACGDTGVGALAEVKAIVAQVVDGLVEYEKACKEAKDKGLPLFIP